MAEQNSYRWHILAASFLILVIDGGVRFSFGVLIKPLVSESGFCPLERVRVLQS
jgi:hypothetical protein